MITTTDSTLLAQVQASIAAALAALDDRERLASPPPASPSPETPSRSLDVCRQRVTGLSAHASGLASTLHQVDSELSAEEKSLRAFLADAAGVRQKLAAWTGRAVG